MLARNGLALKRDNVAKRGSQLCGMRLALKRNYVAKRGIQLCGNHLKDNDMLALTNECTMGETIYLTDM